MAAGQSFLQERRRALRCVFVAAGALSCLLTTAAGVDAGTVTYALGEILEPEFLNEGDEVAAGTLIATGADGLVIIEQRWRSDQLGRDCVQIEVVGANKRHEFVETSSPGQCMPTKPGSRPDTRTVSREIRYGEAKMDEPNPPEKVRRSAADWRAFDEWLQRAPRTYRGKLESVRPKELTLKHPRTGRREYFALGEGLQDASLGDLVGQLVRVDYRQTAAGLEARAVTSTEPPPPKPPPPASPKPPAPPPTGKWVCAIDLHQGDTGELVLSRRGERVRGEMFIERGSQRHLVSGTWEADTIKFWRDLGNNSRQHFQGTVVDLADGTRRKAGRFANQYRGVWSADCDPSGS